MYQEDKLNKNIFWNTIGTTLNAVTSLVFLVIVTRINSVDDAGIFSFAFSNACVLSVIGMYMGRTYQVSEQNKYISDSDYVYQRIFSCILMIFVAILMLVTSDYSKEKVIIFVALVFYKAIEAFSDVLYGVLQKNNGLYLVGKSFSLKAILCVFVFAVSNILFKKLWISCVLLCIVSGIVTICYDMHYIKKLNYKKTNFSIKKTMLLFKWGAAICITTVLSNYIINASKYAIDDIGNEKIQAIFGIILMPATVLSLVGQFIIQPYLVRLTTSFYGEKYRTTISIILRMILVMIGVGILCIVAAYLMGIPVLELLYGINLKKYKIDLMIILSGAIFYGIGVILQSLLTVMRHTTIQMIIYSGLAILAAVLSKKMINVHGLRGASQAYFSIMICEVVIYIIVVIICFWNKKSMFMDKGEN